MPIIYNLDYFSKMCDFFKRRAEEYGSQWWHTSKDHHEMGCTNDANKFVFHAKIYIEKFKFGVGYPAITFSSDYKMIMIHEIIDDTLLKYDKVSPKTVPAKG